jgi:S1-C subfamily serine protease
MPQQKSKQRARLELLGSSFVLALIAGALAGIISSVLTDQSLRNYTIGLQGRFDILNLATVKPQALPGSYEESLHSIREFGLPSVVSFYLASEDTLDPDDWIRHDDTLGFGAVVTDDGWVLAHKNILDQSGRNVDALEAWVSGERYAIQEFIEDPYTSYVMVRLEGPALSAFAFGTSDTLRGGEQVFVPQGVFSIIPTDLRFADSLLDDFVLPAEEEPTRWVLGDDLSYPAPIMNTGGQLIGYGDFDAIAYPLHDLMPLIQSALHGRPVSYAGFGAGVVPMESILNAPDGQDIGAMLVPLDGMRSALIAAGPAELAGLQDSDLILSVNGTSIDAAHSLAEILLSYQPGDTVSISFVRDNTVLDVDLTFGSRDDLVY